MLELDNVKIEWLGHSGFRISGKIIIYIDPFHIDSGKRADLILITHSHYDHCSLEDLKKIAGKGTVIIAPPDCLSQIRKIEGIEIKIANPVERIEERGVVIETIPAYNIKKQFHPRDNNWLGYIITIEGKRIYHAGDTDFITEMRSLKDIDVAMLPVGGTYTMDAKEASEAANSFSPKIAVPMHYSSIVGKKEDAEEFMALFRGEAKII